MSLCLSLVAVALLNATVAQATSFPVKYSSTNRYLVDQAGVPFPIMGRTAWFVLALADVDYRTFLDDTASRGFTAIELHVVNHDPRGLHPPFGGNGAAPFLKTLNGKAWDGSLVYSNVSSQAPDFTTPNESYWSFVDGFLAYAASKNLLVFLFPAYVGFNGTNQGWMSEVVANGASRMQTYGAWIANRYRNQNNLVWMMGGDMGTPPNSFSTDQTNAENGLISGIKSVAGQSTLFSAEWDSQSIATDQVTFGSAMTLNGVYSWTGDVNSHGLRAYSRNPVEPAFLLEEPYDQEGPDGNGVNGSATQPVRRFQWWGWLSTIGGYVSGNGYVWPFQSGWQSHLDTQGSRDMTRLNAFMTSIPWYQLIPSGLNGMRTLIPSGGSSPSAADYVAAAATPDGALLLAYVPPAHVGAISVDMTVLSGSARARWFDPTSSTYVTIATSMPNTGSPSFSTPGVNSAGGTDWLLVIDRTGTISAPAAPTNLRIVH
jgi:hypothetical protein